MNAKLKGVVLLIEDTAVIVMQLRIFKEALAVMLIATALAATAYILRPGIIPPDAAHQSSDTAAQGTDTVAAISIEDARSHFEKGTALFADARPLRAYRSGHIKGAIHLDPDEFDAWSGDFFARIPPDQLIITYCDGVRCSLSLDLAERLTWMGYEKVYFLRDGWGGWQHNRLPVDLPTR